MSYSYLTNYNSPNYTPANKVQETWGRPRTIEAIAIHWWGDPNTNPTFEGVISTLCNPNRGASAHLVATGTGRRVACLIDYNNASWATNSANPYTISIECDPRCRNEDYDVVAELIAQLRQVFGNLPLVPHKQFVATACPGNYDLSRLDREARNKVAKPEWDWGHVENKEQPAPAPTPIDTLYRLIVNGTQVAAYSAEKNAYNGYVNHGSNGKVTLNGVDVTASIVKKYAPVKPSPEPTPDPTPEPSPSQDNDTTTLLQDVKTLLEKLISYLSKIFNIGDK